MEIFSDKIHSFILFEYVGDFFPSLGESKVWKSNLHSLLQNYFIFLGGFPEKRDLEVVGNIVVFSFRFSFYCCCYSSSSFDLRSLSGSPFCYFMGLGID